MQADRLHADHRARHPGRSDRRDAATRPTGSSRSRSTTKLRAAPAHPGINRGYAALGTEALAYSLGVDAQRPDLFEAFNIGPDDVDRSDPFVAADRHGFFAENVWPEEPPSLRTALVAYFDEAHRVALTLTEIFGEALGLGAEWFAAVHRPLDADDAGQPLRAACRRSCARAGTDADGRPHRLRDGHGSVRRCRPRPRDRRTRRCLARRRPTKRSAARQPR